MRFEGPPSAAGSAHPNRRMSMEPDRNELASVLDMVFEKASTYLETLDRMPVRSPGSDAAADAFGGPLPEIGCGAVRALETLIRDGPEAAVHSSGPRFFHFVVGGSTPAALGADWLASLFDQVAFAWVSSPLAVRLEMVSLAWLRELFGLPSEWGGVTTTGATMANFVGLAAARQWWGETRGFDVAQEGLAGRPAIPVFSSGYVHASSTKVLGMLGMGRSALTLLPRDARGRFDVDELDRRLEALGDVPAIVIGNAGEVNTGDFDPIARLADVAERHGAWLHIDGAFGLFARLSSKAAALAEGVERADSVTVDGHKWLNVPYDCGISFVRDSSLLGRTFAYSAAYLPDPDDPWPNMGTTGPESSRRARSLALWATLNAYGRTGYERMVDRHLELAQHLRELVDDAPDLERLAEVPLNIVCFRFDPGNRSETELNELNERLGEALLKDGRFYAGTTTLEDRVALRPAIVNWRTRKEDIDQFVTVVRELGSGVANG
jgi:glutamate/tyrosine decarboxylase-like PLP-dependent enzyme